MKIEEDASIWYGAVLRGDTCSITIEKNANVQDNVVIHTDPFKECLGWTWGNPSWMFY